MAKLIIEDTTLKNIANAIRNKNGESAQYLPSEMPAKIEEIKGGGSSGGGGYEIKYRRNGVDTAGINELIADITAGKWIDGYYMFDRSTRSDFNFLNTSGIFRPTNCDRMFYFCRQMTEIDVSNWDVSRAISMNSMFYSTKIQILDAENWDVSGVENMLGMFESCLDLTELKIENWDVSNVTNMSRMFFGTKLKSFDFLKNWDVSKVTNLSQIFYNNEYATELDLSNWNLANCSTFTNFIAGFTELKKLRLPNLPLFKETNRCIWSNPSLYDIQFANGGAFGNGSTQSTVTLNLAAFWQGVASTEIGEGTYGSYYEDFAKSIGANTSGYTRNIKLYTTLATSLTEEQIALLTDKGYTITTGTS